MTGPEHYREAERLLAARRSGDRAYTPTPYDVAIAQVHATLALAAATAMNDAEGGMGAKDWTAWCEVASINPPQKAAS